MRPGTLLALSLLVGATASATACLRADRPPQGSGAGARAQPEGDPEAPSGGRPVDDAAPEACGPGLLLQDDGSDRAPPLYPADRVHSPVTPFTARRLRAIAAVDPSLRQDVFLKAGDSITYASTFLACVDDGGPLPEPRCATEPTVAWFDGRIEGASAWDRTSLASQGGQGAAWATTGDPSPLEQEMAVARAAFAVVMFGTNDALLGGSFEEDTFDWKFPTYAAGLFSVVDALIGAGVVPIVSSIPPRVDHPKAPFVVETMNALVRGVAQGRQVPFVDLFRALDPLPGHGVGEDGVHLSAPVREGQTAACAFDAEGETTGVVVRNALTLQALDRARRVLVLGEEALDPEDAAPRASGAGTREDPVVVGALPFTDLRAHLPGVPSRIADTSACGGEPGLASGEVYYRLTLEREAPVRAVAVSKDGDERPVRIALLSASGACQEAGRSHVSRRLAPGTHVFVVDAAEPATRPRELLFVVHRCLDGDPSCG